MHDPCATPLADTAGLGTELPAQAMVRTEKAYLAPVISWPWNLEGVWDFLDYQDSSCSGECAPWPLAKSSVSRPFSHFLAPDGHWALQAWHSTVRSGIGSTLQFSVPTSCLPSGCHRLLNIFFLSSLWGSTTGVAWLMSLYVAGTSYLVLLNLASVGYCVNGIIIAPSVKCAQVRSNTWKCKWCRRPLIA